MAFKENFITLGIETSCDETSVSVVKDGRKILSNTIFSQIKQHAKYGGVVPEIASRQHLEAISHVTQMALEEASIGFDDVDLVAVTQGPGLIGALLVGVSYAKGLAYALNKPLIGVNHIEGHIFANFLENDFTPPFLCLVVSGGHSHLVYVKDYGDYEVMGRTVDDAAGEAFDKVARFLGLGYPGGPAVQKAAQSGKAGIYHLPRVYLERSDYEFSFSGLKTATINLWNKLKKNGEEAAVNDLAAEFQEALVDVLVEKTINAARHKEVKQILLAGGVAANARLRERITREADKMGTAVQIPPPALCTDNAAMVACAGYYQYLEGDFAGLDLNAFPQLGLAVQKTCG